MMQIKLLGYMGDEKEGCSQVFFPALYEFLWQTIIADFESFECSNEVTKTKKNQFGF